MTDILRYINLQYMNARGKVDELSAAEKPCWWQLTRRREWERELGFHWGRCEAFREMSDILERKTR